MTKSGEGPGPRSLNLRGGITLRARKGWSPAWPRSDGWLRGRAASLVWREGSRVEWRGSNYRRRPAETPGKEKLARTPM